MHTHARVGTSCTCELDAYMQTWKPVISSTGSKDEGSGGNLTSRSSSTEGCETLRQTRHSEVPDKSPRAILHRSPYCTFDHIAQAAILHLRPYCTGGNQKSLTSLERKFWSATCVASPSREIAGLSNTVGRVHASQSRVGKPMSRWVMQR